MSFMFHPYPYVDHDAVNEVSVPGVSPVRGVIAVAKRIAALRGASAYAAQGRAACELLFDPTDCMTDCKG